MRLSRVYRLHSIMLQLPKKVRELEYPAPFSTLTRDYLLLHKEGLIDLELGRTDKDNVLISRNRISLDTLREMFPPRRGRAGVFDEPVEGEG